MRVRFNYTQDEMVDAMKRSLARSKVVRAWRWKGLLMLAIIAWLATFALFYANPILGAGLGLFAATVCVVLYPIFYELSIKGRLRKIVRENHGDSNSLVCEVELSPHGFTVSGDDVTTTTEWKKVKEIVVTPDTVDIFTSSGSGVVVRDRAFSSAVHRQQFIDLAQSYLELTRQNVRAE
jgi:hypothetical protein